MTRILTLGTLFVLTMDHAHCQDAAKAPAFEVASITPCKPGTPAPPMEHTGVVTFTYPGGRFDAKATTLTLLLEWAYDMQPSQHSDGPSWMGSERYDVVAKAEGNASDAQMKLMMRTLLAERFKLKAHRESKELSVYVVSPGKTAPRLFPSKDGEVFGIRVGPQTGPDQKVVSYHVIATRFSLAQLTGTFASHLGRVMVDKTGLEGYFDFALDLTPDDSQPNPLDASLFLRAMREQLGLAIKTAREPIDFLVINSAEKVTSGN
jgi:uncharacterized protein (TIGR03435 family)